MISLDPEGASILLGLLSMFVANMYIKENVGRTILVFEMAVEELEQEFIYRKHRLPDGIHRSVWGGH